MKTQLKLYSQVRFVSTHTSGTKPPIQKGLAAEVTKTFGHLIESKVKHINGLITRNSGRSIINYLLRVVDVISTRRNRSSVTATVLFAKSLYRLVSTQGMKGAVIHLKALHVTLMQSAAGNKVGNLDDLKRRIKRTRSGGIPRLIPAQYRFEIINGNVKIFQLWSSLFSIYRILEFPGKLKLSTITDPGVNLGPIIGEWTSFIREYFLIQLMRLIPEKAKQKLRTMDILPKPFPILKASPNTSIPGSTPESPIRVGSTSLIALALSS